MLIKKVITICLVCYSLIFPNSHLFLFRLLLVAGYLAVQCHILIATKTDEFVLRSRLLKAITCNPCVRCALQIKLEQCEPSRKISTNVSPNVMKRGTCRVGCYCCCRLMLLLLSFCLCFCPILPSFVSLIFRVCLEEMHNYENNN